MDFRYVCSFFLVFVLLFGSSSLTAYESDCEYFNSDYWYVSMGLGANNRSPEILGNGAKTFLTGPSFDAALGYVFSPHLRGEAACTFRTHPLGAISDSIDGDPLTAEESSYCLLLNGYFSADPICSITPYAGWGMGYGDVLFSIHTNLLPRPNFRHTRHHSKGFAYQFMGGLSYWLNSYLDLAVEYRFAGITNLEYFFRNSHFQTHEGVVKLAYAFRKRNMPRYSYTPVWSDLSNRWYITTKIGPNFRETQNYSIGSNGTNGTKSFHIGPYFAAAIGCYPFCNWVRTEFEFGVRQNEVKLYHVDLFRGSGDEIILTAMCNGYLSPFHFCGVIPYLGGGVGYAYDNHAVHVNLPPNLPNPPNRPIFPSFKHPRQKSHNFAYQFMGGVNYQLTCYTQLGLDFQYFHIQDVLYKSFFDRSTHVNASFHTAAFRVTYLFN